MSKNTRNGAKSREWANLNRKTFLAMNRADALEKAYMQISGEFISAMRRVESKEQTADEAIVHLLARWQEIDSGLHYAFAKIDAAVQK